MLINAEPFLGIIENYRLLHIAGRFGGGKTSFAYEIARSFLDRGYRLVSNNRSVWADTTDTVTLLPDGTLKTVVIIDEGGLYFKASRQVEMIAAYARKMDVIYIIPSFWPPTRAAQVLTCQPLFNFKGAGIPLIVYRWRVKQNAFEDKGIFFWWWPRSIYGIYSTKDPGDTASDIIDYLIARTEDYRRYYERTTNKLFTLEAEVQEGDVISDAATSFAEAADTLASLPVGRRKRR